MINLILFCFGTASLTMFLDMCFQEGMIFHKYYRFIDTKVYPRYPRLYKVIGGCYYCYGTYVFIVLFLAKATLCQPLRLDLVGLILGIGFNYLFIKIIEKYVQV